MPALDAVQRFGTLVGARLGLHFEPRQRDWLGEVLGRRVGPGQVWSYLDALERGPGADELDALAAELTVGETYFFRHHEQLDALRLQALPELLRRRGPGQRLRVLSAGCASGEEAYTLAICLQGMGLAAQGVDWRVEAFDLNPAALRKAGSACYGDWSLRATPAALRGHWFERQGDEYRVLPALRQRVDFAQRNICSIDPAFWQPGAFDVVFCRNMLMYLDAPALHRALRQLGHAIAPGGFLFLGHAETLREQSAGFALRQAQGCFFYQRLSGGAARPVRVEPVTSAASPPPGPAIAPDPPAPPADPPPGRDGVFELLRGDQHRQALRLIERLLAIDAGDAELRLAQAMLLIESGRLDDSWQACAQLQAFEIAPPLRAASHFVKALGQESRGDLAAAEQDYRLAARTDPHFAMPHLRLGLLARRRGELVTMRRELQRALALLADEDERRLLLFGGGFGRAALQGLCRNELGEVPA